MRACVCVRACHQLPVDVRACVSETDTRLRSHGYRFEKPFAAADDALI